MQLDFEKQLNKQLKSLDRLTRFNVSKEYPYPDFPEGNEAVPTINRYNSYTAYSNAVDRSIEGLKEFLLDVIEIKAEEDQADIITKVYNKIQSLTFDSPVSIYIINSADIREKTWPFEWPIQLDNAAFLYLSIERRLHDVMRYVMAKGGYIEDSGKKKIEGPYPTTTLAKRFFSTELDLREFALFVKTCIDTNVIKVKSGRERASKAAVAEMISENFVNKSKSHFSSKSFSNQMSKTPTGTIKKSVIETLQRMIAELS